MKLVGASPLYLLGKFGLKKRTKVLFVSNEKMNEFINAGHFEIIYI